jgi:hypothetical protein
MKQKLFLFIAALFAAVTTIQADPTGLIVHFTDVKTLPQDGDRPRTPVLIPLFYLDGYTLTAADNTVGSTVELLDEDDNVVFTAYVSIEGDIQLPATLSGTYTIEVTRAGQSFIGEIEL